MSRLDPIDSRRLSAAVPVNPLYLSLISFIIFLVTIAFATVQPTALIDHRPGTAYLLVAATIVAVLAVTVKVCRQLGGHHAIVLHAPVFLTSWILLTLVPAGYYGMGNDEVMQSLYEMTYVDFRFSVWGLMLMAVGSLFVLLGYLLAMRLLHCPSSVSSRLGAERLELSVVLVAYAALVAVQLIGIVLNGITYGAGSSSTNPITAIIAYLSVGPYVIIAVVSLNVFQGRWAPRYLVATVGSQLILAFTSGFSKPTLWLAIIVLCSLLVSRSSPRWIVVPGLVGAMALVLVIPISEDLRAQTEEGVFDSRNPVSVVSATSDAYDNTWGQGLDEGWRVFVDKALGRQAQTAHIPGVILMKTPSIIPYRGVEGFLALPAYLIPRAIWPTKPILSRGVEVSIDYLGYPSDTHSSSTVTVFGGGYIMAGWPGAALAALLVGAMFALVYRYSVASGAPAIYLALVPLIIDYEREFTLHILGLCQQLVMLSLLYRALVFFSRRPNPGMEDLAGSGGRAG